MAGRIRSFLSAWLGRRRFERGMAEELQFHIDQYAADLERDGVSAAEARRQARAAFGSVAGVRDGCRQATGLRLVDELSQDVRYAARVMRRTPGLSAAVIVSLALGIGANTSIFTLIDAVLLRSLPIDRPGELRFLAHGLGDEPSASANYPLFERYRAADAFTGVTAFRGATFKVGIGADVELVHGQFVSGNYHAVVGASIVFGRGFISDSDRSAGQEDTAVISDAFWARRFGRSPDVLGRTIAIRDRTVSIVGVTARGFDGFEPGATADLTLPLSAYARLDKGFFDSRAGFTSLFIVARLRSGISDAEALAASDAVFQGFMSEPESQWARKLSPDEYVAARLQPAGQGTSGLRRQYRTPLLILMAMAALVLLVASANVANLLLVRSASRSREVAVRVCVGGGRSRLVRQFLTESALFALAGGALGVLLAFQGTGLIIALFGTWNQALVLDVAPNLTVLAFTTVVTVATGIAFGIAPALKATRVDLTPSLKDGQRGSALTRPYGLAAALIVAQVAFCVVAATAAALVTRSVVNLRTHPSGFDGTNVLLFDVDTYSAPLTERQRALLHPDILERLRSLPGVVSASVSTMTPIHSSSDYRGLVLDWLPKTPEAQGVYVNQVSGQYFETMGVKVLMGRAFDGADVSLGRRRVILNARTARYVFGDRNPIGGTIRWARTPDQPSEVVGVVEDTRQILRDDAPRMVYTLLGKDEPPPNRAQFAIRVSGDPTALKGSLRAIVKSVNPEVVVDGVRTMSEQVNAAVVRERGVAWLSVGFALLASLLGCVGLYGVLSYRAASRTREIGIRLALGAQRRSIVRSSLRYAAILTSAGLVIGVACSLLVTRFLSALLFELSPRDPLTIAWVCAALGATAVSAAYFPARRAARIDPLLALRAE